MNAPHRAPKTPTRRRKVVEHDESEEGDAERWLVSYSDMITVLMCLFIVLFALSQVDIKKYDILAASLANGFNPGSVSVIAGGQGSVDTQSSPSPTGPTPSPTSTASAADIAAAEAERDHLTTIRDQLQAALQAAGLANMAKFRIDARGLTVDLVANDVFFASGSAELTPTAQNVTAAAAPVLRSINEQISVEGHADIIPTSGKYATNWELSSDRATQVLRSLVERGGVQPTRIRATGYGDTQPLDTSGTPQALAMNRRVDLVILSSAPESIRNLIPTLPAKG